MGFFKQVATALRPSNISRGLDAARNPPDQAAIEASLASLTPEQRAAYDANMARVAAAQEESRASWEQAKVLHDQARVLGGPAGRYLYGSGMDDAGSPDELQARIAEVGPRQAMKEMRALQKGQFKDGVRQALGRERVPQLEDPEERAAALAAERAARDAARAPYRAPDPPTVVITRLSTRGETQLAQLLAYLTECGLATRPERVFGVYRVPDRISQALTPHSERGRIVEWDVVHAPVDPAEGPGRETAPPVATSFAAHERWVAKRAGEPSVLDEDLALAWCLDAGIGPERSFGLARFSEFRSTRGGDEHNPIRPLVRGVVAIHPATPSDAYDRMRAAAPLHLHPSADVHVEVLNWAEVGRAQHLRINHPPPAPSPFPYLPATPQELLRAYLDVVGVRPEDSYGVQATVHRARPLEQGGLMSSNIGPKQPCADGKRRMRSHGCEHVVIVHRDRPEYAEGRERWAAYGRDVLQADLRKGTGVRAPVRVADDGASYPRVLRAAIRVAETIDRFDDWGSEDVPPDRDCWPPVDDDGPRR